MLSLTRKEGELIYIYPDDLPPEMTIAELFSGGYITIEIIGTRSHQVKIGIDAPSELKIVRGELASK